MMPIKYKDGVSVIASVRNRSGKHVDNFMKSLKHQSMDRDIYEVIVVDSDSNAEHFKSLVRISNTYEAMLLRITKRDIWNKPLALNLGIKNALFKYTILTDIDMIFKGNFLMEVYSKLMKTERKLLIHCQSNDLPENAITKYPNVISQYDELHKLSTPHNKFGNGACFAIDTQWLVKVHGLDERYTGWGAMDRDISFRAQWDGYDVHWIESTSFLHQWHINKKILWETDRSIRKAYDNNHKLLSSYREAMENGMPFNDQIIRNEITWGDADHVKMTDRKDS